MTIRRTEEWKKSWRKPNFEHGKMSERLVTVFHPDNLVLGNFIDIGALTLIYAHNGVEIGDEAQIGSHCSIYSLNTEDDVAGRVVIGRGVHIGTHSTIMPGVTIGDGARIAAYSFVKNDVPANTVVVGVPAKVHEELTRKYQAGMDKKAES